MEVTTIINSKKNAAEILEMECADDFPKKMRRTYDGGSKGLYAVSLCATCIDTASSEFLVKEEELL